MLRGATASFIQDNLAYAKEEARPNGEHSLFVRKCIFASEPSQKFLKSF
jgi:hypothetical protein